MTRTFVLAFAAITYCIFLGTFLYLPLFLGNLFVPKGINDGPEVPVVQALLVNLSVLGLFAIQHTIMARSWFKGWWIRWVPQPMERSTFVLATSLTLIGLYWLWQPLTHVIWQAESPIARTALWTLFVAGYLMALYSSFLIDHFELFGLRQAWEYWMHRELPEQKFVVRSLYQYVRHPLMSGMLLMFWSAPTMTQGRFFFCVVMTIYIFVGTALEERALVRYLGEEYEQYRRRTSMLFPLPKGRYFKQGGRAGNRR